MLLTFKTKLSLSAFVSLFAVSPVKVAGRPLLSLSSTNRLRHRVKRLGFSPTSAPASTMKPLRNYKLCARCGILAAFGSPLVGDRLPPACLTSQGRLLHWPVPRSLRTLATVFENPGQAPEPLSADSDDSCLSFGYPADIIESC